MNLEGIVLHNEMLLDLFSEMIRAYGFKNEFNVMESYLELLFYTGQGHFKIIFYRSKENKMLAILLAPCWKINNYKIENTKSIYCLVQIANARKN